MMDLVALKIVRNYDCKHLSIEIDEQLSQIRCSDCGSWLDPIRYLATLAGKQSVMELQLDAMERQAKDLETRNRCKCIHCGQMTPIIRFKVW